MEVHPPAVRLAPLREEGSDTLFRWINDRELVIRSAPFRPIDRSDHDAWFERIRNDPDVAIPGIREAATDRLVGSCQLRGLGNEHGDGELQVRLGERDAWGRGYGTAAVDLLLEHAFDTLQLRRVHLHVLAGNEPALRLYRRAGFVEEGRLGEAVEIEGEPVDLVLMGILRADWEQR